MKTENGRPVVRAWHIAPGVEVPEEVSSAVITETLAKGSIRRLRRAGRVCRLFVRHGVEIIAYPRRGSDWRVVEVSR